MEEYSISQNASRCTFYFLSFCGRFVENSTTLRSQKLHYVFIECYFISADQVNALTPLSSCKLYFELNKCRFMMQLCSIIINGLRATQHSSSIISEGPLGSPEEDISVTRGPSDFGNCAGCKQTARPLPWDVYGVVVFIHSGSGQTIPLTD